MPRRSTAPVAEREAIATEDREAEAPLSPRDLHDRALAAIAEHRQRLTLLDAQIEANRAALAALAAQEAALSHDRETLPGRIATARADVLLVPASTPAAQRLAELERAQEDAAAAVQRVARERQHLISEAARLSADRDQTVSLLPALEQRRQEAWAAIGQEKLATHFAAVTLREEAVAAARAVLEQAEREVAEGREAAEQDLADWLELLSTPEVRAMLLPRAGRTALVAVLENYDAFLAEFGRSAGELNEGQTQASTGMPLSRLLTALPPIWLHAALEGNAAHLAQVRQMVGVALESAREQARPRR